MKVGLLSTGGTLDSRRGEAGLEVGALAGAGMADFLRSLLLADEALLELPSPWRIDSSQLRMRQIPSLACAIREAPVDALLLCVGTDTLAFLAPFLWAVGTGDRPVLIVSGMLPWWEADADGAANLRTALAMLRRGIRGLWVASAGRVLPPANLRKISHLACDPFRELAFSDRTGQELSEVLHDLAESGRLVSEELPAPLRQPALSPDGRDPAVAWISVHPGLTPEMLARLLGNGDMRHLVLSGYSGGTFPLWLLEGLPERLTIHLTTQQLGRLRLQDYAVSSPVGEGRLHAWDLATETVISVLSACDMAGMDAAGAVACLESLVGELSRLRP